MGYKIVRKTDDENIKKSLMVDGNACVEYKIGKWTTSPKYLRKDEYYPIREIRR